MNKCVVREKICIFLGCMGYRIFFLHFTHDKVHKQNDIRKMAGKTFSTSVYRLRNHKRRYTNGQG